MLRGLTERWTIEDAAELYKVAHWSDGYFSIDENGDLLVLPTRDANRPIRLKELADRLVSEGVQLPLLFRFSDILHDRLVAINTAFQTAIDCYQYTSGYSCIYPIKVNQQRQIVEGVVHFGAPLGCGLEAGSKPELLAVLAHAAPAMPIICNGFKDRPYIRMALLSRKMNRNTIPVVERLGELDLILEEAAALGVRPVFGVRAKLAARGSGRWQSSGGHFSKFGLTASELLQVTERLAERGMLDCLQLLHFHLGSQITNIRFIKTALMEATRLYVDLYQRGAGLRMLDVGGGLGVDYDGSRTDFDSSVNYTLQEYANDVVFHVQAICDEAGTPHPQLLTESGRAMAAYHSVLVFDVLGSSGPNTDLPDDFADLCDVSPLRDLLETLQEITSRNVLESFHDAQQSLDIANTLFGTGHLNLEQRALAERLFWRICRELRRRVDELEFVPDELRRLDEVLAETCFCNFSLFQSLPDSWAVKQLFPVMPIHRLHVQPRRHVVLGDITCDSDGRIDKFIDRREIRRTLLLAPEDHEPYYLGAFLVGAYQEILGDLHNLFGDTNAVHVRLNEAGEAELESVVPGETVADVLDYVQFEHGDVLQRLIAWVDEEREAGRLPAEQATVILRQFEESLQSYTYLSSADE